MLFLFRKLIFKLMEIGFGLRACFSLETRNPLFLNFKLSEEEADRVRRRLPSGFSLDKISFKNAGPTAHWLSINIYEVGYPKKELAHITKNRCEINTFVTAPNGLKGVFVFCGSPFVSKEAQFTFIGLICDMAERLVTFIYGCGRLTRLVYQLTSNRLSVSVFEPAVRIELEVPIENKQSDPTQLSDDYHRYNDVSFFNEGKTFDLVNCNSAFTLAKFDTIPASELTACPITLPFLSRCPDEILYLRGAISYLVATLNKTSAVNLKVHASKWEGSPA